jgi:pimeloyl-ACP methyl ester carboxylesterase
MSELVLPDGTNLAYERMGAGSARATMLLIHGSAAHGGWWSDVARVLSAEYDVLIPDLPGHGASAHTDDYSGERWAGALASLLETTVQAPAVVVGHSMGGRVATYLAGLHPYLVERLIVVDVGIRPIGGAEPVARGRERRPYAVYDTAEEALDRYRLRPATTGITDAKRRELASRALVRVDEGWTWRSDYRATRAFTDDALREIVAQVTCPAGLIYGGESPFVDETEAAYFESVVRHPLPSIRIPGAGHHVPVEAAAECAAAIRALVLARSSA